MLFQRPNPFPMSIKDNVVAGVKAHRIAKGKQLDVVCERRLTEVGLWDAVKDRLNDSPFRLSGGQQQLLCLARALAVGPDVLLLDEPTSSLDPVTTESIEELIRTLTPALTLIVVTHNLGQAMRLSDYTMFFYQGGLVEHGRPKSCSPGRSTPTQSGTSPAAWAGEHPRSESEAHQRRRQGPHKSTHGSTPPPLTRREPVKTLMGSTRLKRGVIAVATAGLTLSSVVLSSAASASIKLPEQRRGDALGRHGHRDRQHAALPALQPWAGGYNTKYPSVTIQTAGTGRAPASPRPRTARSTSALPTPTSRRAMSANPDLRNIPLAISAQMVAYNVPGVTAHLKLSGKVLSEIYQGQVTKWNDSAIASANPGVTLPDHADRHPAPLGQLG